MIFKMLLVAKYHNWIDAHGALAGNQARQQCDEPEQRHDHHESERVSRGNAEKHVLDEACQTK
jgi:hypothetical protein